MEETDFRVAIESPASCEVAELLAERDAYFDELYEGEDRNARAVDLGNESLVFFTARDGGRLVGCGALVVRRDYGELKRFFVRPARQGGGIGRRLVRAVEQEARARGVCVLRLETGVLQPAAIALYRSEGFSLRDSFGEYGPDPLSVFMEKKLAS